MPPTVTADDFTIAVFPDTQHYCQHHNGIFKQMGQWVADNQSAYNIQAFFHVGDLVENYDNDQTQWDDAVAAVKPIADAGIMPLLSTGNHDANDHRQWTTYRERFGVDWFSPLYDANDTVVDYGIYEGFAENRYVIQELNGQQFLWLTVEYMPRDGVMDWALSVFQNHSDISAGYLVHAYIDYRGAFGTDTRYQDYADANSGLSQWQNWISKTENVGFEIGGHYHDTSVFNDRRQDTASGSQQITEQFHNYQEATANGGDGWFRLLTIDTSNLSVQATTYSPYLDQWDASAAAKYTFSMPVQEPAPSQFSPATVRIYRDGQWGDATVRGANNNEVVTRIAGSK